MKIIKKTMQQEHYLYFDGNQKTKEVPGWQKVYEEYN